MITVLHGYIDDSRKGNIFVLSCLQAEIGMWTWVELAWLGMLEAVNAKLRMQGRKELERYHASDCNYYFGDFEGWTPDEQQELHEQILKIIKYHAFHITAYAIDLRQLQEEIPETKPNPQGFAYVLSLYYLMLEMCDTVMRKHKEAIIGLTHDTCKFNAALREAFDQMVADPNFKCAERFRGVARKREDRARSANSPFERSCVSSGLRLLAGDAGP